LNALHRAKTVALSARGSSGGGISGLLKKAKKILPKTWTQSEEERRVEIERKKRAVDTNNAISSLFQDAPLPVRLMARLSLPLFSRLLGDAFELMSEQQGVVDSIQAEAKELILGDPNARSLLGSGPLEVGFPLSQSSSSSSINGVSSSVVQLTLPVRGSAKDGVAQVVSRNGRMQEILLEAGGYSINVSIGAKERERRPPSGVIEAEIIEKDQSKK